LPAIAGFWKSEVGGQILQQAGKIEREIPFTVRLTRDTDASIPLLSRIPEGEFIVVQGAIDLAVVMPTEIWIVDFKTDQVVGHAMEERIREYSVQLRLYALALTEIHFKPVTRCWLHFFHSGETIPVEPRMDSNKHEF
jgi:ATP-dependent helicase/nuclease subunit A